METKSSTCIACSKRATHLVKSSVKQISRTQIINDESTTIQVGLPTVDLCESHFSEMKSGKFDFGWCDDAQCQMWGPAGATSPCGEPFMELIHI